MTRSHFPWLLPTKGRKVPKLEVIAMEAAVASANGCLHTFLFLAVPASASASPGVEPMPPLLGSSPVLAPMSPIRAELQVGSAMADAEGEVLQQLTGLKAELNALLKVLG